MSSNPDTTNPAKTQEDQSKLHIVEKNFINGQWVNPSSAETADVFDSNTGKVIGRAPLSTEQDVQDAVKAAKQALPAWRALSPSKRAEHLRAVAKGLEERHEDMAQSIAREVGANLSLSRGSQTMTPIHSFETAARIAEEYQYRTPLNNSWVVREPIGVIGAITAWNFPLHLVTVKAAFAMAAGNTVVVKPSEVAPLTAAILAEVIESAGLPAGVLNVVFGNGPTVGEAIVNHPDVSMLTFTGSTRAGKRIGEIAAGRITKVALELGGKSPIVILPDADLEEAVKFGIGDLLINNGQRCDALTRMVVPRERLADVERIASEVFSSVEIGPSTDQKTTVGPVASAAQRDRIVEYIRKGVEEGAELILGGPESPELGEEYAGGYFVKPTVFSNVKRDMTIAQEEIFGPVLSIQPYDSVDEAIEIANDTIYGLHASVWGKNDEEAINYASQIEAGMVTINAGRMNPMAPFGGYKQSGIGREFGLLGFEEFLEVKTMQTGGPVA